MFELFIVIVKCLYVLFEDLVRFNLKVLTCENQHENETIYTYILNVHFYSMPNFGLGVDIF